MPKAKTTLPIYDGVIFEPGTPIVVLRPSLWWKYSGIVKSVNTLTGEHIVLLDTNDGVKMSQTVHAPAIGNQLEVWI